MGNFKPHIGKNVIETLTLGMYDDARFIYREYVQNAADQIDVAVEEGILDHKKDGEINILIDKDQKLISIEDNATGIRSEDVLRFLGDVANSQKDRTKRKGFRGIGRLGGLGYCKKLIFETSYKGEAQKSIVTLNAKQLRKIIEDKNIKKDAASVIGMITTFDEKDEKKGKHYFKVTLENVTNEELLDESDIRDYLSMVGPVPFSKEFEFAKKIHKYYKKKNVKIEEYDVHLNINEQKLYKPYKTVMSARGNEIVEIKDVNFHDIRNDDDDLIAIVWYGISDNLNSQIPRNEITRGIRLRKDNIGIGSETTLGRFFGQERQVLNYIGEVYATSKEFIPNARRDYFNDNKTLKIFEKKLKEFFPELGALTQDSSNAHNRKKEILVYQEAIKSFKEDLKNETLTLKAEKTRRNELFKKEEKAKSAFKVIDRLKKKAKKNKNLNVVIENIIGETGLEIIPVDNVTSKKNNKHPVTRLSKLSSSEKKIVLNIFSILDDELAEETAEKLKKIIAKHYD